MERFISSFSNPRIKTALQLRKPSSRRETGKFLVDGHREIRRAVASGIEIEALFLPDDSSFDLDIQVASQVFTVEAQVLTKLSYGERASEPVAVARAPTLDLTQIDLCSDDLVLVLDRMEKPGNIGACLRTASACAAKVVLTDPICEVFNPNLIRASRGAVFALPLAVASAEELLAHCYKRSVPLYCARVDAESSLWDAKFGVSGCFVFGNEAEGLDYERWQSGHELLSSFHIPMVGEGVDSLNVSISAAITLYEVLRRRSL